VAGQKISKPTQRLRHHEEPNEPTIPTKNKDNTPMRRGITIFLLAAGAIAGFTIGFARLRHGYGHGWGHGHGRWGHDRVAFENHVADVCTRSAERVYEGKSKAAAPPAPAPQPAPEPAPQ
jgi:hypothetical protein